MPSLPPPMLLLAALLAAWPVHVAAQSGKQVKVVFEFRQSGTQSREAVDASGRVVITDRGDTRSAGRVGLDSRERRVRTSTSIFTIVQDGGESTLLVASQVPYPQVAYYRDYLTGAGYLATSIAFKDVGTSLKVRAKVLPGNQIKVRITPTISWLADGRSGVTEAHQASTELIVPNSRPVVLGGATTQLSELTRQILGFASSQSGSETRMTLRATVLE